MRSCFARPCAILACSVLALSTLSARAQSVAYVSSSTDNLQIRVVDAGGGNDRLVLQLPTETPEDFGVGSLSWRPDGEEIAFDSGYDNARSMAIRDLYAVSVNGERQRRLTNGPDPEALAALPKGTVTVGVRSPGSGAELLVYVEGSTEFVQFTAEPNVDYTVTLTSVADLGTGIRQFVRIYNLTPSIGSYNCNFDVALYADVVPGQSVNAGFISLVVTDYSCAQAFSPSWLADGGGLIYLRRDVDPIVPTNDIWQIEAEPVPLDMGEMILDMSQFLGSDRLYRVVAGPAARPDEMLYLRNGALTTPIFLATLANPEAAAFVNLGLCPTTTCKIMDIVWLPDGSGFYISRQEDGFSYPDSGGAIYRYDLTTQQGPEILRARGEAIGRISLSPDGGTLAFERAARVDEAIDTVRYGPRLQCPCEIWTVDVDGTNPTRLVADGRAPAWRPDVLTEVIFSSSFESP